MRYLTDMSQNRPTNSNVVSFTIAYEPIPWKRPGTNRQNIRFDEQKAIKLQIANLIRSNVPKYYLEGCLEMIITFYFPIPASWSRKQKEKVAGKRKGSRPDNTNCAKFYEDLFQDMGFYWDDAQISDHTIKKRYDDGNGSRVEITLKEVNET